ncbi:MAG: hypothetical protein GF381_04045 [Candidatus Pacebacteria bacterium]|nr:hypothetical protein [Candidatus Paceibacterota bacterium]
MKHWLSKLASLLPPIFFSLLIFLIPTNLFLKLGESQAYINGLLVDYLIPKLYLSDLILLGLLISLALSENFIWPKTISLKKLKQNWLIILLLITLIIRQFYTPFPLAALEFGLHLLAAILLLATYVQKKIGWRPLVNWILLLTLIFQSLLGLYQFLVQKSLAGYWLLGEPDFNRYLVLNRGLIFGSEKILPYGTTAHPNVLAGVIVVFWLILWRGLSNQTSKQLLLKTFFWLTTPLILFILFLTQSVTAWLSLVLGISWLSLQSRQLSIRLKNWLVGKLILIFLLLCPILLLTLAQQFPQNPSVQRRANLIQASWQMVQKNPIWGVGFNQFTAVLEKYNIQTEIIRFVQPVHHLGLLGLAEGGLLLACLLTVILIKLKRNKKFTAAFLTSLIILLPIISLDHYLLTLQTGRLLWVFLIASLV